MSVYDADGGTVIGHDGYDMWWGGEDADAAHIILCVNNHDKLVKALQDARAFINWKCEGDSAEIDKQIEEALKSLAQ